MTKLTTAKSSLCYAFQVYNISEPTHKSGDLCGGINEHENVGGFI